MTATVDRPTTTGHDETSGRVARVVAVRLTVAALAAMAAASVLGLVMGGAYGGDDATAAMLRGYDVVTLAVAVPLLAWALLRLRTGSVVAQLVWVAMLGYALYTYAIYVFGAGFNDLFLLHVLAFGTCVFGLPLALSTLPVRRLPAVVSARTPTRLISALLALLALGLGGMWSAASLRYVVDGTVPSGSALVETDAMVHLGIALDLALLVPGYAVAAVLLRRRTGWGYVTAAVVLVSGIVHQIGYLVAMPFQVAADVPGANGFDPAEPVIAVVFLVAGVGLLAGFRGAHHRS